jgi:hypothetical protein
MSRAVLASLFAFVLGLAASACASSANTCAMRGGRWYPSEIDPRLPGSCVMPAVDAGNHCTEHQHCEAKWCACSDERKPDGSPIHDGGAMTGVCPDFPARPEDGVLCVVEHGTKRAQGLQVEHHVPPPDAKSEPTPAVE